MLQRVKNLLNNNQVIVENFGYISLLQIFVVLIPLLTYPYLVRVLGKELYGLVITAQVVASYASLAIDFGFKRVSAKDVSIHRGDKDKLSEIVSSVLVVRGLICLVSFLIYIGVINIVASYNEHFYLFIFSFLLVFNELLFPQFYFQGIEKMKRISFINIGTKTLFVALIFIFIKSQSDYYLVPLLTAIGYFLGGVISLYIIFIKDGLNFFIPSYDRLKYYTVDAFPIFSTKVVASIKDKFSYILVGSFVGMSEVVIYDLGSKFTNLLVKPVTTLSMVLFPKMAKDRNVDLFWKVLKYSFLAMIVLIAITNIILPKLVLLFIGESIDLLPLRVFLIAPLFLSVSSYISSNIIIAFGHNKYIFYSILVTTFVYVSLTLLAYYNNMLDSVLVFIGITVVSYISEFVYRIYVSVKISNQRIKQTD
ncbi:oligosaccharide flippase family protein [Gracilimonas sp. BCB1]|uniref:oligosaccharide flippase family protein n=1 Tax=Gracilimonas sp. BCB1 TaxID=3152362 RepID=UPI0032D94104